MKEVLCLQELIAKSSARTTAVFILDFICAFCRRILELSGAYLRRVKGSPLASHAPLQRMIAKKAVPTIMRKE
jgi:hypothetical protein